MKIRDRSETDFMDDAPTAAARIRFIAVEIYQCAVPLSEMSERNQAAAVGLVLEYVKAIQSR